MTANNIRPSSRKATRRRSQRIIGVVVVTACLLTAIGVAVGVRNSKHARPTLAEDSALRDENGFSETRVSDVRRASRAVYKHSIVNGGVYSQDEVRNAVASDDVVAAHYTPIVIADTRVERVTAPRQAYMSYRIGDQVYWTKKKVSLKLGETIVTDGTSEIRARCGNRISDLAMVPTLDAEPSAAELEAAVIPDDSTASEGDAAGIPPDVNEQALASPDPDVLGTPAGEVDEVPALIAAAPFAGGGRLATSRRSSGSNGSNGGDGKGGGNNAGDDKGGDKQDGGDPEGPKGGPNGGPDGPNDNPGPDGPGRPGDAPPYVPPSDPNAPVSVPEPGSLLLIGSGLAAYAIRRRRARASQPDAARPE